MMKKQGRRKEGGGKREGKTGKSKRQRSCVRGCVRTTARKLVITCSCTARDVEERLMEKRDVFVLGHHLDPRCP
jgi:hypothetical protein